MTYRRKMALAMLMALLLPMATCHLRGKAIALGRKLGSADPQIAQIRVPR